MTASHLDAPHFWSATESLAALRSRRIGAVELLQHYLARQERLGPTLGAVVATDPDGALKAARAFDAKREAGHALGPLAGLTMTIKDTFETEGLPTTAGLPELKGYQAPRDADAVALLRDAGAVIYGKTNCPLSASDHQSYNPVYGLTRNPWDLERTAGGSSGGSAVALAAGLSALELGSDIGGSIRVPSHYCGVYGHKPSFGVIPRRGHVPPMPGDTAPKPLSVMGPIARAAEDLALAMELLAHSGSAESAAWRVVLPAPRQKQLRDFRVGVWLDAYTVDAGYAKAIEAFVQDLGREGVTLHAFEAPPVDAQASWDVYLGMLFGLIGASLPEPERTNWQAAGQRAAADSLPAQVARAAGQSLREWLARCRAQAQLREQWGQVFEEIDVLLCPVSLGAAFPHQIDDGYGVLPQFARTLQANGRDEPYLLNLQWPGLATLAHLPVTVRPLAQRVGGLPVGVQVMGPYLHDRTTIEFARLCDQAFGGFQPPPLALP